jgi:hypothetical protein
MDAYVYLAFPLALKTIFKMILAMILRGFLYDIPPVFG